MLPNTTGTAVNSIIAKPIGPMLFSSFHPSSCDTNSPKYSTLLFTILFVLTNKFFLFSRYFLFFEIHLVV